MGKPKDLRPNLKQTGTAMVDAHLKIIKFIDLDHAKKEKSRDLARVLFPFGPSPG